MNNVLKFLIKLQSDSGNVMSVARRVTNELEQIQARARGVGRTLGRAFSPASLGSSLMSIPGMQFLTNPYTLLGAGIGAVSKLGAEAEMTAKAFSTLVGSEEQANGLLSEIGTFAASSPFGNLDLTANAQQMLSFGVETDKVMGYLRQLGDISGGDKQKLSSLSLVMGQVSASGKLMGQDLMQFINAGFNPLKELQKMHPETTYEQLQEAMSKGAITADMVASAIAHATGEGGQFHGMIEATAQTIAGRWSSAMDALQEMAISLFDQIRPFISGFLDILSKAIPYVAKLLQGLLSVLRGVVSFVRTWGAELLLAGSIIGIVAIAINAKTIALTAYAGVMWVVTTATKAWEAAQWLLNVALNANSIGRVITAVAALVAAVIYCWNKFAGFRAFIITAWDTFKELGRVIKDYVISRINELLEGLGKIGKAFALLFSGEFEGAWDTFKSGVSDITGEESARKAVNATKDALGNMKTSWQVNLAREQAKDKASNEHTSNAPNTISTPGLKGSPTLERLDLSGGGKAGKGGASSTANALATGGTRSTTIHISIGKLVETIAVTMMEATDTAELERVVLQALNRSLAIATSTE